MCAPFVAADITELSKIHSYPLDFWSLFWVAKLSEVTFNSADMAFAQYFLLSVRGTSFPLDKGLFVRNCWGGGTTKTKPKKTPTKVPGSHGMVCMEQSAEN